jgi:multisubunit Na+/H+ antiporter MnhC subunit
MDILIIIASATLVFSTYSLIKLIVGLKSIADEVGIYLVIEGLFTTKFFGFIVAMIFLLTLVVGSLEFLIKGAVI